MAHYNIFTPDRGHIGSFNTGANHPGCAHRVFQVAMEHFIKVATADVGDLKDIELNREFFDADTDQAIIEDIMDRLNNHDPNALWYYIKEA